MNTNILQKIFKALNLQVISILQIDSLFLLHKLHIFFFSFSYYQCFIYPQTGDVSNGGVSGTLNIKDPSLWWPWTMSDSPGNLYPFEVWHYT